MTTAHITHHQEQAESAPGRDLIGFLLLTGIPWTDKNQWAPALGLVATGVIGALVNGWLR